MKGQFAWQQFILLFTYACLMFQNCRFLLTGLISSWLPASLSKVGSAVYLTRKGRFIFGCQIWDVLNLPLSSCNVTLICSANSTLYGTAAKWVRILGKFGAFEERLVIPAEMNFVGERTENCLRLFGLLLMWTSWTIDRVCFRGRFWTVPIPLRA